MLGAGSPTGGLDARDHRRAHEAGQQRVLGVVLKAAPAQRVTVDVHAGAEQDVRAQRRHLLAVQGRHLLHGLRVPGRGQGRAARQQGGGCRQADPRGAVSRDRRRHTQGAQLLRHAAQRAGIALGTQRGVHGHVTVGQAGQVLGTEGDDEVLQASSARLDVLEAHRRLALTLCRRQGLGQAAQDPLTQVHLADRHRLRAAHDRPGLVLLTRQTLEGVVRGGGRSLLQLLDDERLLDLDAAGSLGRAHVGADVEGVGTGRQDPGEAVAGDARVVVGGHVPPGDVDDLLLTLTRCQLLGASEAGQLTHGLAQASTRLGHVDLDDGRGGQVSGVDGGDGHAGAVLGQLHALAGDLVLGVAQTKAEGVEDRLGREGLEVAVADEDVLGVLVGLRVTEVASGRVVLVGPGDRVREATARLGGTGEDVRDGAATLHATAPGQQQGVHTQLLSPGQVHDVAGDDDGHGALEGTHCLLQEAALGVLEVVGARFQDGLTVLTCSPADDHHGGARALRGRSDDVVSQLHLREAQRPLAPLRAWVDGVGLAPLLVQGCQLGVDGDALLSQAVQQVGDVGRVDVTTRAVADGDPVLLDTAQQGHRLAGLQRQRLVLVAQQHSTSGGQGPHRTSQLRAQPRVGDIARPGR